MMEFGLSQIPTAESTGLNKKTPMEVLEDMAREYDELDKLKYDVVPTDTGFINRPTEYVCDVSIGDVKGK